MRERTLGHQGQLVSHRWVPTGGNTPYSGNMVLDMVLRMGSILTVKDETGNEK